MPTTKNAAQALQVIAQEFKIAKTAEQNARKVAIRYILRWVKKNPNYGSTREFYVKDGILWEGHCQIHLDKLETEWLEKFLKEINRIENL